MILPEKNKAVVGPEETGKCRDGIAVPGKPTDAGTGAKHSDTDAPTKELTPEEQMALFEKELKDNDWGHQPC